MGDLFLCLLIFLMIAYTFWDDLFTEYPSPVASTSADGYFYC